MIGDVHFACAAYCSGVGSQYDASGEMHDTVLPLVAVQPDVEALGAALRFVEGEDDLVSRTSPGR